MAAGAVEITWRQCGLMTAIRRRTGLLPAPEEAEAMHRAAMEGPRMTREQHLRLHLDAIRRGLARAETRLAERQHGLAAAALRGIASDALNAAYRLVPDAAPLEHDDAAASRR